MSEVSQLAKRRALLLALSGMAMCHVACGPVNTARPTALSDDKDRSAPSVLCTKAIRTPVLREKRGSTYSRRPLSCKDCGAARVTYWAIAIRGAVASSAKAQPTMKARRCMEQG